MLPDGPSHHLGSASLLDAAILLFDTRRQHLMGLTSCVLKSRRSRSRDRIHQWVHRHPIEKDRARPGSCGDVQLISVLRLDFGYQWHYLH
jgi:hypothetical protein